MNSSDLLMYEAPSVQVFEAMQGGVICASETGTKGSPDFNPFNDEQVW